MSSLPRVLQVVLSLQPGGTERLVLDLITGLHADLPMAVCCLDDGGLWAGNARHAGVPVTALNRRPGFRPMLGRAVAAAARAHRASVVHAHHYSPFVYAALGKPWGIPPIVYTEHGRLSDAPPSAKRRLANRLLAGAPARVFAVSSNLKQHLAGEGWRSSRVDVIYNGIAPGDADRDAARSRVRQQLGASADAFVIVTVARLDPVKDLGTLLDALRPLATRRPPSMLVIVGDGSARPALEARARELGIEAFVRFVGYRDDVRDWLAAGDVYVNCSISEGISLTILEGMAACLPVVATCVGGTPEIIDDTCGRLVPARNAAALGVALETLAANPNLRQTLGAAGRERVVSRFSIDRMVRDYANVYRAVASGRGN